MRGLIGIQLKVERAAGHLDRLQSALREFLAAEPFEITRYDNQALGLHIMRAELKPCSTEIPLTIGEWAYSLRSALDNLACQLALLSGQAPAKSITGAAGTHSA